MGNADTPDLPLASSDPATFRDQMREYLREERADGRQYITAGDIAERFDVTVQRVATNLGPLLDEGALSVWGSDKRGTSRTYEIEVGDDA